jgi:hypothetical protein
VDRVASDTRPMATGEVDKNQPPKGLAQGSERPLTAIHARAAKKAR